MLDVALSSSKSRCCAYEVLSLRSMFASCFSQEDLVAAESDDIFRRLILVLEHMRRLRAGGMWFLD